MLSIALGISLFTPTFAMAATDPIKAVPISIAIDEATDTIASQSDFIGANATIVDILDNQIVVTIQHNDDENVQTYVLNISDETYFVNNETGAASSINDLKKDDSIYVYHSTATTRSLPAQTAAFVILTNVKENESIATLIDVVRITEKDDAISALNKKGDYIIHFNQDTNVMPYLTKNILHYSDIKEGDRILAWFDVAALSYPAQAAAEKAVVLPVATAQDEVSEPRIENLTFAELIRAVVIQIEGEQPMIMDTHYAMPYMAKANELGLITQAQYENQELWNQAVTTNEISAVLSLANEKEFAIDSDQINALLIHQLVVNGNILSDVQTVVQNGVVMVPVRAVAEALDFELTWDAQTSSATIFNSEITSTVQLGYNHYFTKSISTSSILDTKELGVAPRLVHGTTYVPANYFNLLLGSSEAVSVNDHVLTVAK